MPDEDVSSFMDSLTEADFAPPAEAPLVAAVAAPVDQVEPKPEEFIPLVAVSPPPMAVEDTDLSEGDFLPQQEAPAPRLPVRMTHVAPAAPEDVAAQQDFFSGFQVERDVPLIEKEWMKNHVFTRVETVEQVKEIVDNCLKAGRCSLDTETEGLDTRTFIENGKIRTVHRIVGYCISYDGHTGYYIPVRHKPSDGGKNLNVDAEGVEQEITRLCRASQPTPAPGALEKDPLSYREFAQSPQVIIYFWNAKFDQEMLFPVTGIDWWHPDSFEDGMLACFCHVSSDKALSLKHKSSHQLRDQENNAYVMIELKELFLRGRPIQFATLAPDEPSVIKYGCSDAICTFLMCEPPRKWEKERIQYIKLAKSEYAFTYRLEKQTVQAVRVMERYRVKVDKVKAGELLEEHRKEFARLLGEIQNFASAKGYQLDPSSTKQLSDFLFTDGKGCMNISPKPEKNEASGQYKTDGETLEGMVVDNPHAPPILKWIVSYRGVEKMIGTYLEHLTNNPDHNSELRFNFKQIGAGTGRFSAPAGEVEQGYSGVPIHGIPNESVMRKLFLARDGYTIVKADYAGQELRIAANVSGEPVWLKEFTEGDGDLHTITARAFFNKDAVSKDERRMGKTANFALIYGGGPQAIIRATGCDKMEASRRKQAFDKAVPTFAGWIKSQQRTVKDKLGVWTPFKRWLAIPDARNEDRKIQAACERYAVNYPIQGSGADIMKIAMVTLHKEFYKRGWLRADPATGYQGDDSIRMLLTVHDEIVFEVKHGRVTDAVPVIVHTMEMPGKMSVPRWIVPLVVEPLVGPNWGTGYKCDRKTERLAKAAREKKPYKLDEGEVELNGFVYGTIREVDLGKELVCEGEVEHARNDEKKKLKIRIVEPAWILNAPKTDDVAGPAIESPATPLMGAQVEVMRTQVSVQATPQIARTPTTSAPEPKTTGRIVVLMINRLTLETVVHVQKAIVDAWSDAETGKILKLTDTVGTVLIDPSTGIRVNPNKLAEILDKVHNIGDGRFTEEN